MAEAFPDLTTRPALNHFDPVPALPEVEPDEMSLRFLGWEQGDEDLGRTAKGRGNWIWEGYLAAGKITTLTSMWKSGKTTLISILFAQMEQGGQLATLPVAKGRAAIISEEGAEDWHERCQRLRMGKHLSFFCRPFKAKPTLEEWLAMLKAMRLLQRRRGLDLVVIDTLTTFLPGDNENTAGVMMKYLMPLRDLTDDGLSVLLVHHPRKGRDTPGLTARGSGALPSHADINLEMSWVRRPDQEDRRRWLRAFSRARESRRSVILELLADGSNYALREPEESGESAEYWQVVEMILGDAWKRMTQREILEEWPEDFVKPDFSTLSRCLHRAQTSGRVMRRGAGKKNEPFQFWLPGKEEDMRPDEGTSKEEWQRWHNRWLRAVFMGKGKYGAAPLMTEEDVTEEGNESESAAPERAEAVPTTEQKPPDASAVASPELSRSSPLSPVVASPQFSRSSPLSRVLGGEGSGVRGKEAPREIIISPREVLSPSGLPTTPQTQEPAAPAPAAKEPPRMPQSPTEYVTH